MSSRRFAAGLLLLAALAPAQEFRGTILGQITDPTGAAVPGAQVEVLNADTGTSFKATSNQAGNYQVPFLLPGNYKVAVECAGFKKVEREGIRVSTTALVTVDFRLDVGTASESVTVTASAPPLLETASGDLSQVVTREFVETIEFSTDRNIASLALLAPGVHGTEGGTYTAQTHAEIAVNGGGGLIGGNEYLVDGIPNTTSGGSVVYLPSIDSVEEFKVHTTMFDASLGHTNGGAISITTKGGGNQLHGSTYWYFRRTALMANSWVNNRHGNPRGPVKYDQFGYVVSGPVVIPRLYDGHNRTFFSTSMERDNDNRPLTPQNRVPTELERKGDFSQTRNRINTGLLAIYDPATTVVTGSSRIRQPFAGARIPASRISPIGAAIMSAFPLPTVPGEARINSQNWAPGGYYNVKQRNLMIRADHVLSDRQRMFARFGRSRRLSAPGQSFYQNYIGSNVGRADTRFTNFGLDDTVIVSPSLVGTLRLGLVRRAGGSKTGAAGLDPRLLNLPDIIVNNQFFPGWPTTAMGEDFPASGSKQSRDASDMYSLTGSLTKLAGPWSLKFGGDYRINRWNTLSPGDASFGSFTFNSTFTRQNSNSSSSSDTSGTSMASLLLGIPASGSFGYVSPLSTQNHYLAFFSQNDWKVFPRLTLNFGLRWEMETPYTERFNRMSYTFDRGAKLPLEVPGYDLRGGIRFAGVDGYPRRGGPLDLNNVAPRFGFAWQPIRNTVIRGGYGIFYAIISNNATFRSSVDTFNCTTSYIGTLDGGATIYTTLANPFPSGLQTPLGSSAGLLAQVGESITFFDDQRVSPYNQQWQFSVQRQLPAHIVLEAAYVGMLGLKGVESFNLNERPDRYLVRGTAENNRIDNPFYGVFPPTTALGQTPTITQSRFWVEYPQFTSVTVQGANTRRTIYHALQTKLNKRLSHGLSVIGTYTFSRLMDNNMTSLVNERHYRSVSERDHKHVMRVAVVYQTQYRFRGSALMKVLDKVLAGWRISNHISVSTGAPLSVSHTYGRPLRIAPPALSGSVSNRLGDRTDAAGNVLNPYFNTQAFVPLPGQYVITPEPPSLDDLRAPTRRLLATQLFKSFPVRERIKLELNFQADNATNTPQWANPGTNMSSKATFGVITNATNQRTVMSSLRLRF